MTNPVKRSYDSTGRRAQAQETQRAILRAAHDLFVAQGYGRTTIAQVAERAGVSPETIYATFRNKATLLHRTWDVTIGGDDEEVVFHERPEVMAIRAEPDLAKRLMMHARFSTATARRMTPFVRSVQGAAASEPSAAKMAAEMERQRLAGLSVMAQRGRGDRPAQGQRGGVPRHHVGDHRRTHVAPCSSSSEAGATSSTPSGSPAHGLHISCASNRHFCQIWRRFGQP